MNLVAYTDGASRGNPGPAAYGFTIEKDSVILQEDGQYIGNTTNNVAEYSAFIAALELMRELGASEVEIYSDSELAVRQINGQYKVRNAGLRPLYEKVMNILKGFNSWKVTHIPRSMNSKADGLANKALNEQLKKKKRTSL